MKWSKLYSVLKMTREGKNTLPMENGFYKDQIMKTINIKDIEEMNGHEIKEAVINYLELVIPEFIKN